MSVTLEKIDLSLKYTAHYNDVKEILKENSADILNKPRSTAFQDFVLQGMRTHKNENYKYTNLQPQF